MKRVDKVKRIGIILDELYPETPIPLNHTNAYTLLVAVMLSAQTTDKKVNEVTPDLFKYAKTPEEMVLLSVKKIQSLIQKIGLAPTKAKNLKKRISIANKITNKYSFISVKFYEDIIKSNKTINLINYIKKKIENQKFFF